VGGAADTVGLRVLINESLHGAIISEEDALDSIASGELALSMHRAKSADATNKRMEMGQVGVRACGLDIRRIIIISMMQNSMNLK
jgi:hypothetical protein